MINLEAILMMVLGGAGGLLGKWVWDRYLSQSSRVSEALCDKITKIMMENEVE